jgi:flagellar hook capping protein FlgD
VSRAPCRPLAGNRRGLKPEAPRLPTEFALHANQPNPFARLTTLRFALPQSEHVRLEVFDLLGRRVSVLADGTFEAGEHAVQWDGRGAHGALLSAGVYVARIHAGEFRARRTMVLLP